MEKYQHKLCISIACTSVCAYIGLKVFSAIHENQIHYSHYLVCGLALAGVFIGGYDIGWHLGLQQQQQKIKELLTKCAELEVKNIPHTAHVSEKSFLTLQHPSQSSDSDSDDYNAVRIKNV